MNSSSSEQRGTDNSRPRPILQLEHTFSDARNYKKGSPKTPINVLEIQDDLIANASNLEIENKIPPLNRAFTQNSNSNMKS